MSLILVGSDNLCLCDCAMKCVAMGKSGMAPRCTKQQIEDAGYRTVQLHNGMEDEKIRRLFCIDGDHKTLRIDVVRNGKPKKKLLF